MKQVLPIRDMSVLRATKCKPQVQRHLPLLMACLVYRICCTFFKSTLHKLEKNQYFNFWQYWRLIPYFWSISDYLYHIFYIHKLNHAPICQNILWIWGNMPFVVTCISKLPCSQGFGLVVRAWHVICALGAHHGFKPCHRQIPDF